MHFELSLSPRVVHCIKSHRLLKFTLTPFHTHSHHTAVLLFPIMGSLKTLLVFFFPFFSRYDLISLLLEDLELLFKFPVAKYALWLRNHWRHPHSQVLKFILLVILSRWHSIQTASFFQLLFQFFLLIQLIQSLILLKCILESLLISLRFFGLT